VQSCRHLAGEIGAEWSERVEAEKPTDDLLTLVQQIVPFHMAHNAEPEAVDLLLEVLDGAAVWSLPAQHLRNRLLTVKCCMTLTHHCLPFVHQVEQLPLLQQYVDETNFRRSCLYLVSTCAYLPPPDDVAVLQQVRSR
jgi:26S proteasome regulatory subunit N1